MISPNRRKALKMSGSTLLVSSFGVAPAIAQQESENTLPEVSWTFETGRAEVEWGDSRPAIHAVGMTGEAPNVDLSEHQFEIERTDTDQRIQLEFDGTAEVDLPRFFFRIYGADGEIRDQPTGEFFTGNGRTEHQATILDGDRDIFSSGNAFGSYVVHIIQNGERISSTEEKIYGIGYPANDYQESNQNGNVRVSINAIGNITSSWQITYEIENQARTDRGYDVQQLHKSEMELDDGQLVTSFHTNELEPKPDDGVQVRWIRFTPPGEAEKFVEGSLQNSSSSRNTSLSIGGHFFEDELTFPDGSGGDGGGIATFFSSPSQAPGITGPLAGGGILGGGYLMYRWRTSDDESQSQNNEPTPSEQESPSVESTTNDNFSTNLARTEMEIDGVVSESVEYEIRVGEIPSHDLSTWVITPGGSAGKTIDTGTTEDFLEIVDQWANVDTHEYLTTVYGHGTDPLPWIATEPADGKQLGDEFSIADRIDYLTHVCEAVHHVSRFGLEYENLTPESILVNEDGELQLRGVIDEFLASETNAYQPPEDTGDSTHDAADVYRVGAVAYEILTGERPATNGELSPPSTVDPDLPAEVDSVILKAMAKTPEERYETVLHLRDALSEV